MSSARRLSLPWRDFIMKPATLSILSGIMIGTSYIPFPPWAAFFCFLPLWIVWFKSDSWRTVFWTGWLTQFVFTLIGFNWVAFTVHEFGHLPWPVSLLVLLLFCGFANLYVPLAGLVWLGIARGMRLGPWGRLWTLPILVAFGERWFPMIFDWNFGYSWLWAKLPAYHLADIFGFMGLSTLCFLVNGLALWAWQRHTQKRTWWPLALSVPLLFFLINIVGYWHGRAGEHNSPDASARFLLVQANIGNEDKLLAEQGWAFRDTVINRFADLSRQGLHEQGAADFIVWPETAFPDLVQNPGMTVGYPSKLKSLVLDLHTKLITGALGRQVRTGKISNAFFVLGENGEWMTAPYEKTMLLAFGEYFPGGHWFPQLYQWFPEVGDLARGPGPTVLNAGRLRLGAQICYEGLFDWFSRDLANKGAQILVNLTNDSWYGTWQEPFQHGFMTLARAVEVRRPMVRSTNTGLTAVALASGEIMAISPLHEEWFHLYDVPYATQPETTLFMTWGYSLLPVTMGLALFALILVGRERRE